MDYSRQEPLGIVRDQTVSIVGCGGVGNWLALFLVLAGIRELHLFDEDKVEEHNLNRLCLPSSAVGHEKALALREHLLALRPDLDARIEAHGHYIPGLIEPVRPLDWIVALTDTLETRQSLFGLSRKVGCYYVEGGLDGLRGNIAGSPATWKTDATLGYAITPSFVGSAVIVAAMIAYHILLQCSPHYQRFDFSRRGLGGGFVFSKETEQ